MEASTAYKVLIIVSVIYPVSVILLYRLIKKNKGLSESAVTIIEAIVLFVFLYFGLMLTIYEGIGDTLITERMVKDLVNNPFFGYYDRFDIVYPPLFNYIYFIVGKICFGLGIPITWTSKAFVMMLKIPNIVAMLIMAAIVCRVCKKTDKSQEPLVFFMALIQPAYIIDGLFTLQFEALYTLFILCAVMLVMEEKVPYAYFAYAAGVMLKYQTIFITPILIAATINYVFDKDFKKKRLLQCVGAAGISLMCMGLMYLPFQVDLKTMQISDKGIFSQFFRSAEGFSTASFNAYNFWTLMGYNMHANTEFFGPFTCQVWSIIAIVVISLISIFLYYKGRNDVAMIPLVTSFLETSVFCFANKMMSRYLFPALILLVASYAIRPSKKRLVISVIISVLLFINMVYDFFIYRMDVSYDTGIFEQRAWSLAMLIGFVMLCAVIINEGNIFLKKKSYNN